MSKFETVAFSSPREVTAYLNVNQPTKWQVVYEPDSRTPYKVFIESES